MPFHEPRFKGDKVGAETFWVQDKPLMRTFGSIYWYSWGNQIFDIREFRKLLNKKNCYVTDSRVAWDSVFPFIHSFAKAAFINDLNKLLGSELYDFDTFYEDEIKAWNLKYNQD